MPLLTSWSFCVFTFVWNSGFQILNFYVLDSLASGLWDAFWADKSNLLILELLAAYTTPKALLNPSATSMPIVGTHAELSTSHLQTCFGALLVKLKLGHWFHPHPLLHLRPGASNTSSSSHLNCDCRYGSTLSKTSRLGCQTIQQTTLPVSSTRRYKNACAASRIPRVRTIARERYRLGYYGHSFDPRTDLPFFRSHEDLLRRYVPVTHNSNFNRIMEEMFRDPPWSSHLRIWILYITKRMNWYGVSKVSPPAGSMACAFSSWLHVLVLVLVEGGRRGWFVKKWRVKPSDIWKLSTNVEQGKFCLSFWLCRYRLGCYIVLNFMVYWCSDWLIMEAMKCTRLPYMVRKDMYVLWLHCIFSDIFIEKTSS